MMKRDRWIDIMLIPKLRTLLVAVLHIVSMPNDLSRRFFQRLRHNLAVLMVGGVCGTLVVLAVPVAISMWTDSIVVHATVSFADLSPVDADIKITPQSFNGGSNGSPLEAHISFDRGRRSHTGIVFDSVTMQVYGGSEIIWPVREISRSNSKLIVEFDRQDVISLIDAYLGLDVTLEVRGEGDYACKFAGIDTIKFIPIEVESESIGVQSDGPGATDDGGAVPETTEPTEPNDESGKDQPSTDDDAGTESSTDDSGTTGESEPGGSEGSESESTDSP